MMMPTTSEGEADAAVAMAMRDADGGCEDVEDARRSYRCGAVLAMAKVAHMSVHDVECEATVADSEAMCDDGRNDSADI